MNIIGLESCLRKLNNLQYISETKDFEDIAKDMENKAKNLSPVRTGELRNSIGSEIVEDGNSTDIKLYATASHAMSVELGTSKMPARPFLRPAMMSERNKVDDILRENIRRRIK